MDPFDHPEVIYLDDEDWNWIILTTMFPPGPTPTMREAHRRYEELLTPPAEGGE